MEHWKTHSAIGTKASALSLTKPSWPSQHDLPTTLHTLHLKPLPKINIREAIRILK
jgi:hypothetical protein